MNVKFLLYNGETSQVVARIRALETQNPTIAEVLEREVAYFQKHAQCMQYRAFNKKDIRSAAVASRLLVNTSSLNAVNKQACTGQNPASMQYFFDDVC